ncbi:hypothetical protein CR513_22411, partial [Mucuna pruriens]
MGSEETNVPSKPSRRRDSDVGRESAHAWPQHRSPSPPPCVRVTEKETIVRGNNSNNEINVSMSSDAQYCYYLLEAMPQPGPTWSTTGPSVLAQPTPTPPIEGLDSNMTTQKLDPPFVENVVMENYSKGLSYESEFMDAIDLSGCCPDDWLIIPTMEQDFGDIVLSQISFSNQHKASIAPFHFKFVEMEWV